MEEIRKSKLKKLVRKEPIPKSEKYKIEIDGN